MFDVLVTLCLLSTQEVCVERTVPVGQPDCAAALQAARPRIESWARQFAIGEPACAEPTREGVTLSEIAPGLFVHVGEIAEPGPENLGDVANLAVVIGDSAVAVIDSGGSRAAGEQVVAAVRSLTDLPIAAVILTHMHPDHVLGATALVDAGAEVVGRAGLDLALATRADSYETAFLRLVGPAFIGSESPTPDRLVEDVETLDLGGRTLELRAWPTAHTPTDLTVLDEATGTLFAGDLVFATHAPALDGSLRGWQKALETIDGMAPARVVPGHGPATLEWPEGGAPLRRYLEVLARDTHDAIDKGLTLSESVDSAARSEAGSWALFDLYNPRNATAAYTELEWE